MRVWWDGLVLGGEREGVWVLGGMAFRGEDIWGLKEIK